MKTWLEIQDAQRDWAYANFGEQLPWTQLMGVVEELGELAHSYLKMSQGIRGTRQQHMVAIQDAVGDVLIYTCGYCNLIGLTLETIFDDDHELFDQALAAVIRDIPTGQPARLIFRAVRQAADMAERIPGTTEGNEVLLYDIAQMVASLAYLLSMMTDGGEHVHMADQALLLQLNATWDNVVSSRNWKKDPVNGGQ